MNIMPYNESDTEVIWTWERMLDRTELDWNSPRPDCLNCGAELTGWIEHNQTRCPGCGKVAIVKWDGLQLVVEK